MTGRPRLDELYSLACWEPGEEAEAAAILDTLTRERDEARLLHQAARIGKQQLDAEIRELRRILYAAIDPENGATSAQELRDLIQGELNTVAGSNPAPVRGSSGPASSTGTAEHGLAGERGDGCCVRSRPAISSPIATTREVTAPGSLPPRRGPRPQSTEKQGPGALTSFGADDWATVEHALTSPCVLAGEDEAALIALARLRAADQAKTEALRAAQRFVSVNRVIGGGRPVEAAWDDLVAALAAAAAAPKETT